MGRLSKVRQWINQDDGRLFRVGNDRVSLVEVVVVLGVVAALVIWQLWSVVLA